MPVIHVLRRGPVEEYPAKPFEQRSAAWCPSCKRRHVQDLIVLMPIMDSTMTDAQLQAASFISPELKWKCPCGELIRSKYEVDGW